MIIAPYSERRKGIEWTRPYWSVVLLDPWKVLGQGESSTSCREVSGCAVVAVRRTAIIAVKQLAACVGQAVRGRAVDDQLLPVVDADPLHRVERQRQGRRVYTAFLMAIVRPAGPMIR